MMPLYSVGQLYYPRVTQWPEGVEYNYRAGAHEIIVRFANPNRHEVESVRAGECEFGLYVEPPLLVLCYRFGRGRGAVNWSDAPYSWHLLRQARPDEATLPIGWEEGRPETRALVDIVMLDAATGIVKALRAVTWSPEFTRAIHKAIWEQAHSPWDPRAYDAAIENLYRRHTSESLAAAAQYHTRGGA